MEIPNLKTMQKHLESDEVFVLLKGSVTLFTAGNGEKIGTMKRVTLEPGKCYNVKKRGLAYAYLRERQQRVDRGKPKHL